MNNMTVGYEQCESDSYATECPSCHAIQSSNDWPPYLEEEFKCYMCGRKYTGMDLLERQPVPDCDGNKDYYIPYYTWTENLYKEEVIKKIRDDNTLQS